jgi:outer membrane protein OmpA-like peptidoglycan-associated protein
MEKMTYFSYSIFKGFIITLMMVMVAGVSNAQMRRLAQANKLYNKMAYYYAAEAYEDVLARGIDSTLIAGNIADCYDRIENNEKAVVWYEHIERRSVLNSRQLLRYAMVLKQVKKYDLSLQKFQEYEQRFGATELTRRRIAEYYLLERYAKDEGRFEVTNQTNVNTESSDIGVAWFKNGQVFVSNATRSNYLANRTYDRMGNKFYGIYLASVDDDGNLSKPDRAKGNTKFHDGPAVYDPVNDVIYFTRSNYVGGKKKFDPSSTMRLKIFRAQISDKGKITNIKELEINGDSYSTGHPCVSADGKTLFFASDRPGGFGGSDIWKVSIDQAGQTGVPVNMGPTVNTSENEMFPFIQEQSEMLFFSSDGHTGLGGLDVFYGYLNENKTAISGITNMGVPINSEYDDFGFIIEKDLEKGYFVSNRDGGYGDDDIYSFKMLKPFVPMLTVQGLVADCNDSESYLPGSRIVLKDATGRDIATTKVDADGAYSFLLDPTLQAEFFLTGSKNNYQSTSETFSTENLPEGVRIINRDLCMIQIGAVSPDAQELALRIIVLDKRTKEPIEGSRIIIADETTRLQVANELSSAQGEYYTPIRNKRILDDLIYRVRADKQGYSGKVVDYAGIYERAEVIEIVIELDRGDLPTPGQEIIDCLGNRIVLNPIYFDLDKSFIRPDAAVELDKIVALLNRCPNMKMEIGSHTDCRASYAYNDALSRRRAQATIAYIKPRITNPSRLTARGYGEKQLAEPCPCEPTNDSDCSEEQHQLNRRTEFRVLAVGPVPGTASSPSVSAPAPVNNAVANNSASSNSDDTYTIKEGETLYRVFVNTGVPVDEIKRLNGLKSNTVHVGQVLRIR